MKIFKKLLCFILVLSLALFITSFLKPTSKAASIDEVLKPLVVRLNSDISEYLKYDDYVVVNNSVNVKQVGTYNVTYKYINTGEQFIKKVTVIDDDHYVSADFERKQRGSYPYTLKGIANADGMSSYLYAYKYGNTVGEIYSIWVNPYATKLVCRSFRGDIVDFCYLDGHYLGCGYQLSVLDDDQEMFFFDTTDNENRLISIYSKGVDFANAITLNHKYYVVAGWTESDEGIFGGKRDGKDSAVVLVDRETKEVEHAFTLGLKGDDEIIDIYEDNNMFYFLQKEDEKNFRIVVTDAFGNKDKEIIINEKYGYLNPSFKYIGGQLFLKYASYDYEYLDYVDRIIFVDSDLSFVEMYKGYNRGYTLTDFDFSASTIRLMHKPTNKTYGFLYMEYSFNKLVVSYYFSEQLPLYGMEKNKVYFNQNGEIIVYQLNTINVKNRPISEYDPRYNSFSDLVQYDVYMNGEQINNSYDLEKQINVNVFGSYPVNYLFKTPDLDYLDTLNIKVLPFVGIYDNQTYDQGITLNGNALKLRVNNELVDMPYVLNDVGTYKIEIEGKNEEIVKYQINIEQFKEELHETKEAIKISLALDNHAQEEAVLSVSTRPSGENKMIDYLYAYVMPLVTLLGALLFTKKGGKR